MKSAVESYFDALHHLIIDAEATRGNARIDLPDAFSWVADTARSAHGNGNKLMFIGNGGSAGITSHMATDFSKNGNMRSVALNDPSMLTCLGNDYGYEHTYSKQVELHARAGDVLIAISSSGQSANILNAVNQAREMKCHVATLSGFDADNPLRKLGDVNFYISSSAYGFVEVAHLSIMHAILDLAMGWSNEV